METTFIDYAVEDRIATITLNRPEAASAIKSVDDSESLSRHTDD
jgi:enoyl-CoA hydratase/carnithine racemase